MRRVYLVLAWLVAAGVVVQVAAIAFAKVGEDHLVDSGGVIDKAFVESAQGGTTTFVGVEGEAVHAMNGMMVLPVIALLLFIASFFVRGRGPKLWALLVVGLVALQIVIAFSMFDLPYLGILHGVNALAILLVAIVTALKARRTPPRHETVPTAAGTAATAASAGTEPRDAVQA
ncbi:MAG: hypothetical protein JST33_02350 [Actinobacteria bacterium]|nr:hypothetical protein [Actinomycetota bacterium]